MEFVQIKLEVFLANVPIFIAMSVTNSVTNVKEMGFFIFHVYERSPLITNHSERWKMFGINPDKDHIVA